MPIYKRCSRCGKRIPSGTSCNCKSKRYKEYDKDRVNDREKKLYSSQEWQDTRAKAMDKYNGIDLYSYYVLSTLEYAQTVHHIEPVKDNWDKRFDIDNLICLTESNHRQLHYKMDHGEREEVIKLLKNLIERYEAEQT